MVNPTIKGNYLPTFEALMECLAVLLKTLLLYFCLVPLPDHLKLMIVGPSQVRKYFTGKRRRIGASGDLFSQSAENVMSGCAHQ